MTDQHMRVQTAINMAVSLAYSNGQKTGARDTGRQTRWTVCISERESISGSVYPQGQVEVEGAEGTERLDVRRGP